MKATPLALRIAQHTEMDARTGCWVWTGSRDSDGYGYVREGVSWRLAHRASYEVFVGPIERGLTIDHLCRNRVCVNPEHLEPVTQRENTLRGNTLQAANAAKSSCDHGHEFTKENTRHQQRPNGATTRSCRACERRRSAEYRARQKETT